MNSVPPHEPFSPSYNIAPPLAVDVDGTLVSGDLLIEGIFRLIVARPLLLFVLPLWLVGGRAALKRRVARAMPLPPATLVLNPAVLDEIAAARTAGREVWLASGSDELVVAPLVESVGAAGCLASDGCTNLVGRAKADALVEKFGNGGFDYIGNERRDLAVWKQARRAIGVGLSAGLAQRVRTMDAEARFLSGLGGGPRVCFRALRPHQWVKNVLVFAPLIAAHETRVVPWLVAIQVFGALSACASGTYLFNDLLDLPHDRRHASKRHRPLAAGANAAFAGGRPRWRAGSRRTRPGPLAVARNGALRSSLPDRDGCLFAIAQAQDLRRRRCVGDALRDPRTRRCGRRIDPSVTLVPRLLPVRLSCSGHRQAPKRAVRAAQVRPVCIQRTRLFCRKTSRCWRRSVRRAASLQW